MNSTVRRRSGMRRTVAIAAAAALALPVAACSSSSGGSRYLEYRLRARDHHRRVRAADDPGGAAEVLPRRHRVVREGQPGITVKGDDANPCEVPAKFTAQLAAGTEDNVFYTAFTDPANVIGAGQAADIQSYVKQIANESSILPQLLNVYRQGDATSGDLYGIPVNNYTEGLVYNTTLFQKAGITNARRRRGPRSRRTPRRSPSSGPATSATPT
jgi:multiple sugar transport system substrate-binding protein